MYRVSLHIEAGFRVINIKDDGIGISQEAIDRILNHLSRN